MSRGCPCSDDELQLVALESPSLRSVLAESVLFVRKRNAKEGGTASNTGVMWAKRQEEESVSDYIERMAVRARAKAYNAKRDEMVTPAF